jgi:hypothetical protein
VSVSKERQRHGQRNQRRQRVSQRNDVLIFIVGRAMDQLHFGETRQRYRAMGQGAEPFEILRGQIVTRPNGGRSGQRIKIIEVHHARGRFVVIAAHENLSQLPRTGRHFIRTSPISDDVSQVRDHIEGRGSGKSGVQGFEVGVYVAQQQYAHESPDKLPIIDQHIGLELLCAPPVMAQFELCILQGVIPKILCFYQRAEGSPVAHSVVAGDPSLRLKNRYARDDG